MIVDKDFPDPVVVCDKSWEFSQIIISAAKSKPEVVPSTRNRKPQRRHHRAALVLIIVVGRC